MNYPKWQPVTETDPKPDGIDFTLTKVIGFDPAKPGGDMTAVYDPKTKRVRIVEE